MKLEKFVELENRRWRALSRKLDLGPIDELMLKYEKIDAARLAEIEAKKNRLLAEARTKNKKDFLKKTLKNRKKWTSTYIGSAYGDVKWHLGLAWGEGSSASLQPLQKPFFRQNKDYIIFFANKTKFNEYMSLVQQNELTKAYNLAHPHDAQLTVPNTTFTLQALMDTGWSLNTETIFNTVENERESFLNNHKSLPENEVWAPLKQSSVIGRRFVPIVFFRFIKK